MLDELVARPLRKPKLAEAGGVVGSSAIAPYAGPAWPDATFLSSSLLAVNLSAMKAG